MCVVWSMLALRGPSVQSIMISKATKHTHERATLWPRYVCGGIISGRRRAPPFLRVVLRCGFMVREAVRSPREVLSVYGYSEYVHQHTH